MIGVLVGVALAREIVVVREGDTWATIAASAAVDASVVRDLNGGGDPVVGQIVAIPDPPGTVTTGGVLLSAWGGGTVTLPGGGVPAFAAGTQLPEGSVVCTMRDSFAVVRLAIATPGRFHDDVNLMGETCVTVEVTTASAGGRSSVVGVGQGSISVRASQAGHPGTVAVRTAYGVTAGAEGGFRVHVEDGASRTEALTGPVAVFGAGRQRALDPGFGSRVKDGEGPGEPVALLLPGSPVRPEEGEALRNPAFSWSAVERALGYRVEVAISPDFADLVVVQDVPGVEWFPEWLLLPFRVPGVWWRVSSFDRTGFLGIPSDGRGFLFPPGVGP